MRTTGILEEKDGQWRAFFASLETLEELRQKWPGVVLEAREEDSGWVTPVAAIDEPIYVGSRFVVVNSSNRELPAGRLQIVVDSVTAFGTGRHESTQMVLEVLESLVKEGDVVLDAGCGSGILSEACRLLAAVRVIACDIDAIAVRAVQERFDFPLFLGSADALANESVDLVLANISRKAVDALAPEIKRILKPSGHVVVGGFIRDSVPSCYHPWREFQKGDWLCWLCTRDGILTDVQTAGHVLEHPLHWW